MELRTILYGYNKHQFKYTVNDDEADIVKRIFNEYLDGKTLLRIANELTEEGVSYYKERTIWSKQVVRRIIENTHYAGDAEYPAIISRDVYTQANAIRLAKGGDREKDSEKIHYLKYHTRCTQCGERVTRIVHYSRAHEAWKCVKGCKISRYLDDGILESELLEIINQVISNPQLLITAKSGEENYCPSLKIQRDERTLNDLMQKDNLTFQSAKKVLFDILQEKFECCSLDKSGAVTEALISYVGELQPLGEVDIKLLNVLVDRILIRDDGQIAVRFINGAEVGKNERSNNDG